MDREKNVDQLVAMQQELCDIPCGNRLYDCSGITYDEFCENKDLVL